MTFNTAEEMLTTVLNGTDLYSPSEEFYLFVYNDEQTSICTYWGITNEEIEKYLNDTTMDEYYGAYLGFRHSGIYDDDDCLELCKELFTVTDWIDITK